VSALPTSASVIFGIAEFSFASTVGAMTFAKSISHHTAAHIISVLGCPRGTAYDWLDGRREPPQWQQRHWLKLLGSAPAPRQKRRSKAGD
jgi:hypothetical protein